MAVGQPNVRLGSKADISACPRDVRLTPKADIDRACRDVRFVPKDRGVLVPRCRLVRLVCRSPGSLHLEDQILARAGQDQPLPWSGFGVLAL
jgi:hypothetical protein